MNKSKKNIIIIDGSEFVYCPVCGTLTAVYDICDKCGWQNTGETNIDGGPNHMTLAEAKKAYAEGREIN
ncbi:MAG: CPCC family cysteine-rich protein [Ligilactobacillus agilis]|nr:CPCC family cysteine-rich protein [Ligilactobacillus agilis]